MLSSIIPKYKPYHLKLRIHAAIIFLIGISVGLYTYIIRYGSLDISNSQIITTIWAFIYFLIPANLYIYGIAKISDHHELRHITRNNNSSRETLYAITMITLLNLPFLITQIFIDNVYGQGLTGAIYLIFLFFAGFWSANPIRAKSIAFLDMIFLAISYISISIYGFALIMGHLENINRIYIFGGLFAIMATYIYYDIYDSRSNKSSSTQNTTSTLGYTNSIILSTVLYIAGGIFARDILGPIGASISAAYIIIMALSPHTSRQNLYISKNISYCQYIILTLTYMIFYLSNIQIWHIYII